LVTGRFVLGSRPGSSITLAMDIGVDQVLPPSLDLENAMYPMSLLPQ
jgi:hypothetical protein